MMALSRISALLLVLAASCAHGGSTAEEQTQQLIAVVATIDHDVAILDSVDDPSMRCLHADRPVFVPEQSFAVYLYHYPNQEGPNGTGKDLAFCVVLNSTADGYFPNYPCGGDQSQTAQQLYFDGSTCFIARFQVVDAYHCILFVKTEYKDSVSEDCLTQFGNKCGSHNYTLYSQELCPDL